MLASCLLLRGRGGRGAAGGADVVTQQQLVEELRRGL
jgi:hypothetical protein